MKRSAIKPYMLTALAVCGSLLLGACAAPLTVADNGRRIEIPIDGVVEVELEGNPTTGYSWEIAAYNKQVLQPVGDAEYTPDKKDSKQVGGGGVFRFEIKGVAAGSSTLQLVYRRSWEKDVPPAATFEVTVVVGTMGQIEED